MRVINNPPVPGVDSADNSSMRDVIGNKSDTHDGTSIRAVVHTLDEHAHKAAQAIPTGAAGVVVTCGDSNAWDLGNFAVLIATNAIDEDFDIHFIVMEAMSANATYEVVLYSGADGSEVEIGRVRVVRITNQVRSEDLPFQCQLQAANAQIKAKVMSSTGALDTVTMSLYYHTY